MQSGSLHPLPSRCPSKPVSPKSSRVGNSPLNPSKSLTFRKQGLSLCAPGPSLYVGFAVPFPSPARSLLSSPSRLPSLSPVPLDCCFAPRGRPSKNAPSPEPLSLAGRVPAAPAAPPSVVPEPLSGRLQGGQSPESWPRPGPAPPPAA